MKVTTRPTPTPDQLRVDEIGAGVRRLFEAGAERVAINVHPERPVESQCTASAGAYIGLPLGEPVRSTHTGFGFGATFTEALAYALADFGPRDPS